MVQSMVTAHSAARNGSLRAARRSAARGALLKATAEILSETTQIEAPFSEISRRSKVNSAMIKHYFGDKQGLLMALLEREAATQMGGLEAVVAMNMSAERKMAIHIEGIVNAYYRAPYLNRLVHYMVETGGEDGGARVSRMFIEPMMEAYRAILAQGVREGSMRDVDPGLLYYALVGAADHLFFASYSVPTTLGVSTIDVGIKQAYASLLRQMVVSGLAPTE